MGEQQLQVEVLEPESASANGEVGLSANGH